MSPSFDSHLFGRCLHQYVFCINVKILPNKKDAKEKGDRVLVVSLIYSLKYMYFRTVSITIKLFTHCYKLQGCVGYKTLLELVKQCITL